MSEKIRKKIKITIAWKEEKYGINLLTEAKSQFLKTIGADEQLGVTEADEMIYCVLELQKLIVKKWL